MDVAVHLVKLLSLTTTTLVVILGCARPPVSQPPTMERARFNIQNIERIDQRQEQLDLLENTPTSFKFSGDEAQYAWERALEFLKSNTQDPLTISSGDDGGITIANRGDGDDPYLYGVIKKQKGKNTYFIVTCVPKSVLSDAIAASKNAKIFAEFIRSGSMDASLLDIGNKTK